MEPVMLVAATDPICEDVRLPVIALAATLEICEETMRQCCNFEISNTGRVVR
jgi:hypothetical protein